MPREPVSFNSSRIQRAYRINNIEETRLLNRLQLLDKERIHQNRVTNQDIRLITITLDYIQSSSGKSPEGEITDAVAANKNVGFHEEFQPCFMYGERTGSRRFGKNRRPKSAASTEQKKAPEPRQRRGSVGSLSSQSTDTSSITSKSVHSNRPHSSASSSRWDWPIDKFHTYKDEDKEDSDDDDDGDGRTSRNGGSDKRTSTNKKPRAQTAPIRSQSRWAQPVATGWSDPMGAKVRAKTGSSPRCQTAPSVGRTGNKNDDGIAKSDDEGVAVKSSRAVSSARLRSKRDPLHAGKSRLTQMVNQVRVMTTAARTWRNAAKHSQNTTWMASYTPASSRRQYEAKLAINQTRASNLDVKVQDFMNKFPMPKHVATVRRTSSTSAT